MTTPGFYAIIPATVRYCKEIEMGAKLLYGELTALAVAEGYCWASNEYFSENFGVDNRTIQRWLKSLQDEKFIKIQIEKNGMTSFRKIWISEEVQKMFTMRQKCRDDMTKMSPSTRQKCHPINKEINIKEKEEGEEGIGEMRAAPPSNPPPQPFSFKRVKMDQEKFETLVKDFGKNTIDEMLDRLDEYADINPKRFKQYACHAAVIRKWIRDDKDKFVKKSTPTVTKTNKEMAEKIIQFCEKQVRQNEIQLQEGGLLFCYGNVYEFNKFDDFGFRDKTLLRLRKMNLSVEGL